MLEPPADASLAATLPATLGYRVILESTTTVESAAMSVWDVIVIGAGPAGSLTAERLANKGRRVLLLDAKKFPREKVCGGCINELALSILSSIGLRELIERLPATPIKEYMLNFKGRSFKIDVAGGIAVSRAVLDTELVRAAIHSTAEFLAETTGKLIPRNPVRSDASNQQLDEFREVQLEVGGHPVARIRSRVVVIADGLARKSLQLTSEFPVQLAANSWIGLHTTFPVEDNECPKGQVRMLIGNAGYVGTVQVENHTVNLAAAVSPRELKRLETPLAVVSQIFQSAGASVPEQLAGTRWNGTGALTRRSRSVANDRVMIIGDAAGYVEPFTGEGVGQAMCSALKLTEVLLRSENVWEPEMSASWNSSYRWEINSRQSLCRALATGLHYPWFTGVVFRLALMFPRFPQFVVNQLSSSLRTADSR